MFSTLSTVSLLLGLASPPPDQVCPANLVANRDVIEARKSLARVAKRYLLMIQVYPGLTLKEVESLFEPGALRGGYGAFVGSQRFMVYNYYEYGCVITFVADKNHVLRVKSAAFPLVGRP